MTESEKRSKAAEQIRVGKIAREGQITKLREEGLSYADISKKLGIAEATVRFIGKKYNK